MKGSWKRGSTAGGRTNFSDNLLSRKFATNPQYLIKNEGTENCKCVVALSQSTMGIKHDDLLSIGKAKSLFCGIFLIIWDDKLWIMSKNLNKFS